MCLGRKCGVRCGVAARQIRLGKCGEMGGACGRSKHSENGAVFGGGLLSLSLSLSRCSHFWHAFAFNLKKLFAHSNFKAKIQIFHSKFNSFYNFISNFKPYTRLFHIFTPSFRSVQTDKKFFTRRTLCLNRNF